MNPWLEVIGGVWLASPLVCGAAILLARRAIRRGIADEVCFRCGYDLAGIWPDLPCCPECGAAERGHATVISPFRSQRLLIETASLAIVWWAMFTLAAVGIAGTIGGGIVVAAAQTGQ